MRRSGFQAEKGDGCYQCASRYQCVVNGYGAGDYLRMMEAVSGLIGAVIGGALVAIVTWLLRRADVKLARNEEHKQAYRNVLSYLLDVYGAIRIMRLNMGPKIHNVLDELFRKLSEKFDVSTANEAMAQLRPLMVNQMLTSMAGPFMESVPEFKEAISRLAPIDPLAAFHIRAHRNVMIVAAQFEQIVSDSTGLAGQSTALFHAMVENDFKPLMLDDVLNSLVEMIEDVGAHVEPVYLADAREFISRQVDENPELTPEDHALIEKLLASAMGVSSSQAELR